LGVHYSPQEMLAKLVGFNTVSDRSNLPLIDFVADYLGGFGIESRKVFDDTGQKASLYAVVGPMRDDGVVLSAHTDVVPVENQTWSSDPFTLRADKGRFYGRGTADMKGFAATVLAHVPAMLSAGLSRPIHIALSYDEEVGCLGAPPMIADMLENAPRPSAVVVGEPTNMAAVTGHKGIIVLETKIQGYPVHSSQLDRGVSAISAAAKLISWLDHETEMNKAKADQAYLFDPPYTTLHCGMIKGGDAHNITAAECEFVTDIRTLPAERGEDWQAKYEAFIQADVLPAMLAVEPTCRIDIKRIANVPGLSEETDGAAEQLVRGLTGDNGQHVVVFATEGGQFQEKGLSTVVCGPGSIDQAHQADEFIEAAELERCTAFLDRLCKKLSLDNG
jgi:acetylornithine deacetylase